MPDNKSYPTVSVIVPNYNYARYLEARMTSILTQTFQDFEIILLDDASTDGSRETVERYREHPKVSHIVMNATNSGSPFRQWEKGMGLASGEYIWIAEADDLATPEFLEHTVAAMERDREVSLAVTLSHIINENGDMAEYNGYDRMDASGDTAIYEGDDYIRTNMLSGNGVYNASMVLFRAEKWRGLTDRRYLDMRYCGDWQFWIDLMRGERVAVVRQKLNMFRKHGRSVSDEGTVNEESLLEILDIQTRLLRQPPCDNADCRLMTRYRWLHKKNCPLTREQLMAYGINRSRYPLYWIYKHFFRWTRHL